MTIDEINLLLTTGIRHFTMSLYSETRVLLSLTEQVTDPPVGLQRVVDIFITQSSIMPRLMQEFNINAHKASLAVARSGDPILRIALWSTYLEEQGL